MKQYRVCLVLFAAIVAFLSAAAQLRAQSPTEDQLLQVLESNAPAHEKSNASRELRTVGTEKSIAALAKLLLDADTAHGARIALEAMPYPAAGAALRDALPKTSGLAKSGIIDSLGKRRDAEATPAIAAMLADPDMQLVAAAAVALGKIGTTDASAALRGARAKAQGEARAKLDAGLLICGDRLLAANQPADAAAIFGELAKEDSPRPVRAAALRGLVRAAGPKTAALIIDSLVSNDELVRAAATGELRGLSADDLRAVAANMAKYPADSQTAIVCCIRIRGEKSLLPVVLAAAKSDYVAVRQSAAAALGVVGDISALPALVELAEDEDAAGPVAQKSLEVICGPKIDEQILVALRGETDAARRAGWIGVLEARRPQGVVAILLDEAAKQNAEARSRALIALGKLAGPEDVAAIVAIALKSEKGARRDDAERAVRAVCLRIADAEKRADPVLAVARGASEADRLELLPLLGRIGGGEVRKMVDAAMESTDAKSREAGMRALCNWPDASVAEKLLELTKTAKNDSQRIAALRAYIRVISLPGSASDEQRLALLKQAMTLASRDEDRGYVIERASAVRTLESLRFVLPYVDQAAFAQDACASVTELARHKELRLPNKAEFVPALEKVLGTCKDKGTLERARRYLQSFDEPN